VPPDHIIVFITAKFSVQLQIPVTVIEAYAVVIVITASKQVACHAKYYIMKTLLLLAGLTFLLILLAQVALIHSVGIA